MKRIENMSIVEIAELMIYLVTIREGFGYHTPMNLFFKNKEDAINATASWLSEQIG